MYDNTEEQRLHRRQNIVLTGRVQFGVSFLPCLVTNISASGARVTCHDRRAIGRSGTLAIGGAGRLPGRVVWQAGDVFGLQFHDDPETVRCLVEAASARYKVRPGSPGKRSGRRG